MSGIVPKIRTFLHRDQVLLDTLPLLMHIIIPNLRSVSIKCIINMHFLIHNLFITIQLTCYFYYKGQCTIIYSERKR